MSKVCVNFLENLGIIHETRKVLVNFKENLQKLQIEVIGILKNYFQNNLRGI